MALTAIPAAGAKLRGGTFSSIITELRPLAVEKTGDETVNNSNVLQNDDELFVPVAANSSYDFQLVLFYNSGTTPDFKFGWTFPTGLVMRWSLIALATTLQNFYLLQTSVATVDGTGAATAATAQGSITTTNAGTLQLQWAQTTANASDTKVLLGSLLTLKKTS